MKEYKKLSVVVPCFNELNSIEEIIKEILKVEITGVQKEIIIVDDFSTDGTRELLNKLKSQYNFELILQDKNQGKTDALKAGFAKATGDVIIVQDADLEYDPQDYIRLIRPFQINQADVVYGSRFIGDQPKRKGYATHSFANKFMTWFSNFLGRQNLTDIHSCYIMMDSKLAKEVMAKITSKKFGFNPELAARLAKIKGVRIVETGISYYPRTKEEGKKIGVKDGIQAMRDIVYYNLFVRN